MNSIGYEENQFIHKQHPTNTSTFTGTITDPPICDALGNLENAIIVMNLTGEITQPGQSKFHRIKLDPYRSYMIEAIGQNGEDMLGVEEHRQPNALQPRHPGHLERQGHLQVDYLRRQK